MFFLLLFILSHQGDDCVYFFKAGLAVQARRFMNISLELCNEMDVVDDQPDIFRKILVRTSDCRVWGGLVEMINDMSTSKTGLKLSV